MSERLRPRTATSKEIKDDRYSKSSGELQLLWPSIQYGPQIETCDVSRFPDENKIYARHDEILSGNTMGLRAFESAVMNALNRVLVLDPHFDETGVEVLTPALSLSQAWDVRLLTSSSDLAGERRNQLRNMLTESCNTDRVDGRQVEVLWSTALQRGSFPYLHDRFAIIDGDLWHFGSTVGGGHRGLTAASGPWAAAATYAVEFFDMCWRTCNARSAT